MRVFRLVLLCAVAYVVSVLFLFPAAPIIERIKPMIQPVKLTGVDGKLLSGSVARVSYDDDVFPVEASNVTWKLAPQKLLSAAAGVKFTFDAYGGQGDGVFAHRYNGDMDLTDVTFNGPAKGLEALLPLPVAAFNGDFAAAIETAEIRNQLLSKLQGKLTWSAAVLESPIRASLGNIDLDIQPVDEQNHRGNLQASGGELDVEGTVNLSKNGDYSADILVTPRADATPELQNALRGIGQPDNNGRYRIQQSGNVNRLM